MNVEAITNITFNKKKIMQKIIEQQNPTKHRIIYHHIVTSKPIMALLLETKCHMTGYFY